MTWIPALISLFFFVALTAKPDRSFLCSVCTGKSRFPSRKCHPNALEVEKFTLEVGFRTGNDVTPDLTASRFYKLENRYRRL